MGFPSDRGFFWNRRVIDEAATEALAAGRGGILIVFRITGVARSTIGRGLKELRSGSVLDLNRAVADDCGCG
jgi:hypothetical protein